MPSGKLLIVKLEAGLGQLKYLSVNFSSKFVY